MKIKTIYLFILFTICQYSPGAAPCVISQNSLSSLDSHYISGKFRIYYSSNPLNINFIPDQTDLNQNKIPDYVENIAIQANATTDSLTSLGFMHPLESPRYKDVAEFIDIHLLSIKNNGVAFEMPTQHINKSSKEKKCALILEVRNNLEQFPGNYWTTVTHEVFHLYQYGYSQFKGGWYLESMANLMERTLRLGSQGTQAPLPTTTAQLEQQIYNVPYNSLWHRLVVLADKSNAQLQLPSELLNRKYIDGSKVFKDDKLRGHTFIKSVLENMHTQSNIISQQNGWDPHNWAEADQVSPERRPAMLKTIQDSMWQFGMSKTPEEIYFLKLK